MVSKKKIPNIFMVSKNSWEKFDFGVVVDLKTFAVYTKNKTCVVGSGAWRFTILIDTLYVLPPY